MPVAEETHAVGASGVDGDQDDIGRRGKCGEGAAHRENCKGEETAGHGRRLTSCGVGPPSQAEAGPSTAHPIRKRNRPAALRMTRQMRKARFAKKQILRSLRMT